MLGVNPLLGEEASLSSLQDMQAMRVLHLATHGVFRPDNPLFSGLAFPDGWLSTLDIFQLQLPSSLITLSACETGRSVLAGGDELIGLMRAFFSAGASSLLQSLWTVHDESTAAIMSHFYRNLQSGDTKAEALRNAQLSWLEQSRAGSEHARSHPYFWAPFMLVGASGLP